jgi:putative ABC transport system permease protein
MREIWRDLRFGIRTLIKRPEFAITSVAILAVGIGVNAAVFTLTNGALFKSLPFDKNSRIAYIAARDLAHNEQPSGISYPDFRDWQAQAKSFAGMTAFTGFTISVSDNSGRPAESYLITRQSANGFRMIGQRPLIGRDFLPADEVSGAPPVVILSYGVWDRRYGKDESLIGKTIRAEGIPTTVIGVMPQGFAFPFDAEMWMPIVPTDDSEKRQARDYLVYARLADGATLQSAGAEMAAISSRLQTAYPATDANITAWVQTFNDFYFGPYIVTGFLAMLGAVGFVLLIACANVANLLLGRAMGRSHEISMRVALGAGRGRVIRQLLVEAVILSAVAGILGLAIGKWGVRIFDAAMASYWKPANMSFSMDYKVFLYLAAISLATGIVAGLAPVLRLAKLDVNPVLKDGGRGFSTGPGARRLSNVLVSGEAKLAPGESAIYNIKMPGCYPYPEQVN